MAARGRGRGRRGVNPIEEPTRGADAFIAAMNTMAEAVRETATATRRAIDRLGERNGDRNGGRNGERGGDGNDNEGAGNHDNPMTLATFLKVNPPKFKGTLVATEADNWFRGIEKSLRAQHVPERQYVEFATYMLEGEAEHWWHGVQRLLRQVVEEIDWDTFKEEFYKNYFPRTVRDAKEIELMQLTQGNMSVAEYTRKFEDLCRFSKICQGNPDDFEEWKCLKYEGGLRDELMHSLVPLKIRNFAELVNESQLMEDCEHKMAASRMGHPNLPPRNFNNFHTHAVQQKVDFKVPGVPMRGNQQVRNFATRSTTGNGNRPRQDTGKQPQQQSQEGPTCRQCGKNHPGRPCYLGLRVCYNCGEPGHITSNCPEKLVQGIAKSQQPGRVFTVTAEDARTQTP
ncbi:uncharacterized protein LOC130934502 [Arachis stenosperma]|uniref:uncharacterized protein LOC130934502 n=1 Tax=Arachis stenosperma TaxID=217475 RepID=UPI0025AD1C51|nr:uncharacterized protein LOC130934502 [Arachis stenosperma]